MIREHQNVLAAFAQGRQAELHDVEPVKQILAELKMCIRDSAVSGQRKLMSLLDMRSSKQPKNTASKNTPSRICGLVAPALNTRNISALVQPFRLSLIHI